MSVRDTNSIPTTYTCGDQLINILSKTTKQASNTEDGVRPKKASLPTKNVAELAVERLKGRKREEVRSSNPTGQVQCIEFAPYPAITGDDNGLICGRKEELEKSAAITSHLRDTSYADRKGWHDIFQLLHNLRPALELGRSTFVDGLMSLQVRPNVCATIADNAVRGAASEWF